MSDDDKTREEQHEEAVAALFDGYAKLVGLAANEMSKGQKAIAMSEAIDEMESRQAKQLLKVRIVQDANQCLGILEAQDEAALDHRGSITLH